MQLTAEHESLRDTIARFVDREINPHVDDWEAEQQFPSHTLFKQMGDLGLLGIQKPAADGGMGLDYSYAINGSRMWITNGMQADWICLLANTSDGPAQKNKSLIVVPLDTPGVTRARKLHKLGMWSSDTAQIFFDDVRVPRRFRIGDEGMGFTLQMQQFQEERIFGAASSLKGMENIIPRTIDYTRDRETFGRLVLTNQVVHFRLAELQTEVEALRALVYRCCERYTADAHDSAVLKLASMAKLKAGRLAREVCDACLQYWGGMGYMWKSEVARAFRDTRLISIGGGADEIMLGIICKTRGILPGQR